MDEKSRRTSVKVAETEPILNAQKERPKPTERMNGAFLSIICSATIPCGLVLIIFGALIGVILGFRIDRNEGYPELKLATTLTVSSATLATKLSDFKKNGGTHAFFIDFNPSSLTAIATLTGKIVPYLSSSVMALIAFFAARRIVMNSNDMSSDHLLSPHQLSILIELLGGSTYSPLNNCVQYHIKNNSKWVNPLPLAFTALALVTSLGILIPAIDTWFSTTVTPTTVATVKKSSYTNTFGRDFDLSQCSGFLQSETEACSSSREPCNLVCSSNDTSTITNYYLEGTTVASDVMNNIGLTDYVLNYYDSTSSRWYYYMADKNVSYDLYARDYRTTTLAVSTQCTPITASCLKLPDPINNPGFLAYQYDFQCPGGLNGSLLSNGATSAANYSTTVSAGGVMAGISFSPDARLSTRIADSDFASFQNPLHFGTWSVGWQIAPANDTAATLPWDWDPEIFYDWDWNYAWMLKCESALYNVEYTWVNGSITEWNTTLSPADSGGMLSLPFVSGLPLGSLALSLAATRITNAPNSSVLAHLWGEEFSRNAIGLLAGSMRLLPNSIEQDRNNSQPATRVPMIPLFLLLGVKLLYCLAIFVLAVAAYYYTDPQETQSVKERLTVKGLAAAYFAEGGSHQQMAVKNVEELFQASASGGGKGDAETVQSDGAVDKVAIKPTEQGGWQFVKVAAGTVWTHVEPIVMGEVIAAANTGAFGASGQDAAKWVGLVRK